MNCQLRATPTLPQAASAAWCGLQGAACKARPGRQPVPLKRQGINPSKLLNNAFNPRQPKTHNTHKLRARSAWCGLQGSL